MPEEPVVCTRCHSLHRYGKVKDPMVENLLPEFDFDHTVGRRLGLVSGARSVVLMGKSGNVPRIVLVVTKIDLLPSSLSSTRFEHWVRQRAREGGASKIAKLHFVSPARDWGVKSLVADVVEMAGPRGTVWAVGAQNAGKSTLINAIGKYVGGKIGFLTEAPVPGTTLGIPHQMTTRLTREEQNLLYVSTVHIAGLMRLDIAVICESLYVTVWASPYLPLHMGKTEKARTIQEDHFSRQLQPQIGEERVEELGSWVRKEFQVSGNRWDSSSVDIAAAGIGWFAIGLKGEAVLGVWTYDGVEVVLRNALIPHRAQLFEEAGFSVAKIVSNADQTLKKSRKQSEKNKKKSDEAVAAEL
ncbi:hypothetical protein CRYUN_Cryun23aG0091000 [Craigia yunnanensis]